MSVVATIDALFEDLLLLHEPIVLGELPPAGALHEFYEQFLDQVDRLHRPGASHPLLAAWPIHWMKQVPGSLGDTAMAQAFHRLMLSSQGSASTLYLTPSASAAWDARDLRLAWRALCPPALAQHVSSPPGSPRLALSPQSYSTSTWWGSATRRTLHLTKFMREGVPGWTDPDQQEAWRRALMDGVRLPAHINATAYTQQIVDGFRDLLDLPGGSLRDDPCVPCWQEQWHNHGEIMALWRAHITHSNGALRQPARHGQRPRA